jgi:Holliday junction resolvase RusA-like endonuclease
MRGKFPVVLPSNAYLKFEKDALEQLRKIKYKYRSDVDVSYTFTYKGKLWTDVDNAIAGLNDILQKAGVLDDDKQIKSGTFIVNTGKDWKTDIEISSLL